MKITRFILAQKGFTLLELLLVMVVIAAVAGIGVTTFNSYSKNQAFSQAVFNFVNTLNTAKARAYSQVKPDSIPACNGSATLDGYYVIPDLVPPYRNYFLGVQCSGGRAMISQFTLPAEISFQPTSGTPPSTTTEIFFHVLTGGVSGPGVIVLTDSSGLIKKVTVSNVGVISVK